MFDGFYLEILLHIQQNAESICMKYILQASIYPNLYKVNLVELYLEQTLYYFDGT